MQNNLRHIKIIASGGFTGVEKYVRSTCPHVRKMRVLDASGTPHDVYVGCGKCDICHYINQQEWLNRMRCHTVTFPNVYFITLTISPDAVAASSEIRDLTHAVDGVPLFLHKRLFQNFMKRLRRYTPRNYSYFMCGEYGSKNSRPHFHLILWCDKPITRDDVVAAWSLRSLNVKYSVRKNGTTYHYVNCIGDVDFNDLYANGTLEDVFHNPDIAPKQDKQNKNQSKNCFKYVSKYVSKSQDYHPKNWDVLREYIVTHLQELCDEYEIPYSGKDDEDVAKCVARVWRKLKPYTQVSLGNSIGSAFYDEELRSQFSPDVKEISVSGATIICPAYFKKRYFKSKATLSAFSRSDCSSPIQSAALKYFNLFSVDDSFYRCGDFLRGFIPLGKMLHEIDNRMYKTALFTPQFTFEQVSSFIESLSNSSKYLHIRFYNASLIEYRCYACKDSSLLDKLIKLVRHVDCPPEDIVGFFSDSQVTAYPFQGEITLPIGAHFYDFASGVHYYLNDDGMFAAFKYDNRLREDVFLGLIPLDDFIQLYSDSVSFYYDANKKKMSAVDDFNDVCKEWENRLSEHGNYSVDGLYSFIHSIRLKVDEEYKLRQSQYELNHNYI